MVNRYKFVEIPPGKREILEKYSWKKRGEAFFARGGLLRSQTKVMEKCRDVHVVFVDRYHTHGILRSSI
jgi:hypothetical protein